jgi:replication-associated recombination protein RarA
MVSTLEFKELETHCLHFFNFNYLCKYFKDIIVRSRVNGYISLKDLLDNKGEGYCTKQIRKEHNINNANMIILGTSGSGKSTAAKLILRSHIRNGYQIVAVSQKPTQL